MGPKIIGMGVGRTGTYSLKKALTQLGLGPCHHMEEVMHHMPVQLPLWQAAMQGKPDWAAISRGTRARSTWPTAGFFRELGKAYPEAKFILSVRSPESWAASFSETIYKLSAARDQAPPQMQAWLDMAIAVIAKRASRSASNPQSWRKRSLRTTTRSRRPFPLTTCWFTRSRGVGAALQVSRQARSCGGLPEDQQPRRILGAGEKGEPAFLRRRATTVLPATHRLAGLSVGERSFCCQLGPATAAAGRGVGLSSVMIFVFRSRTS